MIRHIVLLRFRPDVPEAKRTALVAALQPLKERIEGIIDFHNGANISVEPHVMHGFTDVFWFDFRDHAARATYLAHPDHVAAAQPIVDAVEGGLAGIVVMDVAL